MSWFDCANQSSAGPASVDASVRALHDRLPELGFPDIRPVHCTNVFRVIDPDGTKPGELARRAGVSPQAMAEFVGYLEEAGYVQRRRDAHDGRSRIVVLTPRGREAAAAARQAFAELQRRWERQIGPRQLDQVRAGLSAMAADE